MACGESAKEAYQLLDDLGGEDCIHAYRSLFDNLVRYMSGDEIEEFVEYFRRVHGISKEEQDEEVEETT